MGGSPFIFGERGAEYFVSTGTVPHNNFHNRVSTHDEFSAKEFDRFLSETASKPEWVYAHPFLVNGYWRFRYSPIRIIR